MFKRFSTLFATSFATIILLSAASYATPITYSTSGAFTGPDASGGILSNGTATITFNPQAPVTVNANPTTGASLGDFVVTGGTGTFNDTFSLTITQSAPVGSATTSTAINGMITGNSDSIVVSFAPATLTIGGVVWNFNNPYFLVPPASNGGVTTIQAGIVAPNVVPEPASLVLLGSGMIGLGGLVRRKVRTP